MDQCNSKNDHLGTTGTKAFLPPGFDSLEGYIQCLQTFLAKWELITDLMIVDYFTTNSWETRMPKEWREAFESEQGRLNSQDLMELVSLGNLRDFNCQGRSTSGSCAPSDQQGLKDWPESLKEFVAMVKRLSINRTLDPEFTKFKDTLDIHLIPGMSPKKLHEVEILSGLIASCAKEHSIRSVIDLGAGQGYLSRVLAFQHHLCVLGVDSNTIQTCGAQTTQKRTEKLFVNKSKLKRSGAEGKKGSSSSSSTSRSNRASRTCAASSSSALSTVAATSSTVAPVAMEMTTETTTAVSSCSTSISQSVITGDEACVTLVPATKTDAQSVIDTPASPLCKRAKANARSRSSSPVGSVKPNTSNTTDHLRRSGSSGTTPCRKGNRSRKTKAKNEETQNMRGSGTHTKDPATTGTVGTCHSDSASPLSASVSAPEAMTTTSSISDTTVENKDPASREGRPTAVDSANDPSLATTPGSNFQLQHITHHITASTLPTLLKEHFPRRSKRRSQCLERSGSVDGEVDRAAKENEEEDEEGRWTLCGLHACGDLTSNMIKLYLESSATCLFSVGCCYHCMTERFDRNGNVVISDGTHGFPLSAVFNRHKAHLGEHAKMTACQSPERWIKYQKETEDAIHGHYFRALLHKLMVERGLYPGPPAVAPVLGRMGKHRLKGFPHYLATAIHRFRLPTDVIKSEEAQAAYEQFLEKDLYRIGILWALRTMLGPLFEGMILLDRAVYLHENVVGDGTGPQKGSVQLIPGFDVVESPRNMILIALKD
ncbi:hypothetical protein BGX34_007451 [Mortierella sp. NVP85]|nr:hypothetical protein BGX34_007451 [Mortierella sp. NVP85]